jgi:DNA-binding transcriptional MerR regulator
MMQAAQSAVPSERFFPECGKKDVNKSRQAATHHANGMNLWVKRFSHTKKWSDYHAARHVTVTVTCKAFRVRDTSCQGDLARPPFGSGLMAQSANIRTADTTVTPDAAHRSHDRGNNAGEAETPMTIGEVAREFGMTLRALRFYEAKRLITPQRQGGGRIYLRSDRERISLILTGRRLGFTLAEIKRLLDGPDGKGLRLTREKCVEQINLLERQKRDIEQALGELRQIYTSFYRTSLDDQRYC